MLEKVRKESCFYGTLIFGRQCRARVTRSSCPLLPPQAAANTESSRAQQQALALEQQRTEQIHALEAQLAGLGRARVADLTAAERELVSQGRKGAGSTLLTRSQAARPFDRKKTSLPLNSGTTF